MKATKESLGACLSIETEIKDVEIDQQLFI